MARERFGSMLVDGAFANNNFSDSFQIIPPEGDSDNENWEINPTGN